MRYSELLFACNEKLARQVVVVRVINAKGDLPQIEKLLFCRRRFAHKREKFYLVFCKENSYAKLGLFMKFFYPY